MENKNKINFDLDFLDKNAKEKPKHKSPDSEDPNWVYHKDSSEVKGSEKSHTPSSDGMSDNTKKWAWAIGIIIVISIISSTGGDSSSTPSTSSAQSTSNNSGQVQVGRYMCSSYVASHADSIKPATTLAEFDAESNRIENMGIARKSEKEDLDSTDVDRTDQYAIDSYKERVDSYNARYQTYSNAYDEHEAKRTIYNNQVDTYNNYLQSNCTAK